MSEASNLKWKLLVELKTYYDTIRGFVFDIDIVANSSYTLVCCAH